MFRNFPVQEGKSFPFAFKITTAFIITFHVFACVIPYL